MCCYFPACTFVLSTLLAASFLRLPFSEVAEGGKEYPVIASLMGIRERLRSLDAVSGTEEETAGVGEEMMLRVSLATPIQNMVFQSQQAVARSGGGNPGFSGCRGPRTCGVDRDTSNSGANRAGSSDSPFLPLPERADSRSFHQDSSHASGGVDALSENLAVAAATAAAAAASWCRASEGCPADSEDVDSHRFAVDSFSAPVADSSLHPIPTNSHENLAESAGQSGAAGTSLPGPPGFSTSPVELSPPGIVRRSDAFTSHACYRAAGRVAHSRTWYEHANVGSIDRPAGDTLHFINEAHHRIRLGNKDRFKDEVPSWSEQRGSGGEPSGLNDTPEVNAVLSNCPQAADGWALLARELGWNRGVSVSAHSCSTSSEETRQKAAALVSGDNAQYSERRICADAVVSGDMAVCSAERRKNVCGGAASVSQKQQQAPSHAPLPSGFSLESHSASRTTLPPYSGSSNGSMSMSQLSSTALSLPAFPYLSSPQQPFSAVPQQPAGRIDCPFLVDETSLAISSSGSSTSGSLLLPPPLTSVQSGRAVPHSPGLSQRPQFDAPVGFALADEFRVSEDLDSLRGRTFVGNIPPGITLDSIKHLASQYGVVVEVDYRPVPGCWAFAYILFADGSAADQAAGALHGKRIFEVS